MDPNRGTERRIKAREKQAASRAALLWLERKDGTWQKIPAEMEDIGEYGLGVVLGEMLREGHSLLIEAPGVTGSSGGRARGHIAWCSPCGPGRFRAGLSLDEGRTAAGARPKDFEDFYETLEVNPVASFDTIHKLYRVLAHRLHPDNPDSGNEEDFKRLVRAYQVLADPEKRAAFDVERSREVSKRWRIFDPDSAAPGLEQEQRKRRGILAVLYNKRMRQPDQCGVGINDIEQLLAVPREHLEFPLWYLKEMGWITRNDTGKHMITAKGVEFAESSGAWQPPSARNQILIAAGRTG